MQLSCKLFTLGSVLLLSIGVASAQPKANQVKKLIRSVAGSNLPSSAVRIKQITESSPTAAEATAQIETAFRLEKDSSGQWGVREVRIAPDRWESIEIIAAAVGSELSSKRCTTFDQIGYRGTVANERRARCLLADMFGVELPSDAVRVKSISGLGLPFATTSSATVVASIELTFQLMKEGRGGWVVKSVRSGNRSWTDLSQLTTELDSTKSRNALAEMQSIAKALDKYKSALGFYVATDNERSLIDHLSPRYLSRVVRVDPWNRPYEYQGESNRFTLRSVGPDGKQNTADDIVVSRP
jgi:type II secretion system (T2SS) protein G